MDGRHVGRSDGSNYISYYQVKGYSHVLQGKVVDMFYFPLFDGTLPNGQPFSFFNAIFNVADACISVGLVLLLIFMRKYKEE